MSRIEGIVEDFNQETVLEGLMALKRSLDEQRRQIAEIWEHNCSVAEPPQLKIWKQRFGD